MLRCSAIFALTLAALVSTVSAGCSTSTGSSREVDSREELVYNASPLVGPGTLDIENVFLPAVMVHSFIPDSAGKALDQPCSGVLIHQRAVLTAAHCVCLPRAPTPEDKLLSEKSRERARALKDMIITDVVDKHSPCARTSVVVTLAYGKPGESLPEVDSYLASVLIHPEFELIMGTNPGQPWAAWSNADLAVLVLNRPVPSGFRPVSLSDSEVKVGDPLIIVGYGSRAISDPKDFGSRRFGDNEVTGLSKRKTGNVLFRAAVSPGPKYDAPAHARRGDSGGACVRKDNPNILMGVIAMGTQVPGEAEISYFTSVYPYERWLSEILRRIELAADAGVSLPAFDAGVDEPASR